MISLENPGVATAPPPLPPATFKPPPSQSPADSACPTYDPSRPRSQVVDATVQTLLADYQHRLTDPTAAVETVIKYNPYQRLRVLGQALRGRFLLLKHREAAASDDETSTTKRKNARGIARNVISTVPMPLALDSHASAECLHRMSGLPYIWPQYHLVYDSVKSVERDNMIIFKILVSARQALPHFPDLGRGKTATTEARSLDPNDLYLVAPPYQGGVDSDDDGDLHSVPPPRQQPGYLPEPIQWSDIHRHFRVTPQQMLFDVRDTFGAVLSHKGTRGSPCHVPSKGHEWRSHDAGCYGSHILPICARLGYHTRHADVCQHRPPDHVAQDPRYQRYSAGLAPASHDVVDLKGLDFASSQFLNFPRDAPRSIHCPFTPDMGGWAVILSIERLSYAWKNVQPDYAIKGDYILSSRRPYWIEQAQHDGVLHTQTPPDDPDDAHSEYGKEVARCHEEIVTVCLHHTSAERLREAGYLPIHTGQDPRQPPLAESERSHIAFYRRYVPILSIRHQSWLAGMDELKNLEDLARVRRAKKGGAQHHKLSCPRLYHAMRQTTRRKIQSLERCRDRYLSATRQLNIIACQERVKQQRKKKRKTRDKTQEQRKKKRKTRDKTQEQRKKKRKTRNKTQEQQGETSPPPPPSSVPDLGPASSSPEVPSSRPTKRRRRSTRAAAAPPST